MKKTLASMLVGSLLGLNVLACGPDEINNYYGAGGANGGEYNCYTMAENYAECDGAPTPLEHYPNDKVMTMAEYKAGIAALCLQGGKSGNRWLDQNCLDCMSTAPCERVTLRNGDEWTVTPDQYCKKQGLCLNADF
ncbi:hypothetical protein HY495_01860 [Candidatus Woesearchaeota archaeon]|nr:hypothetical protein [Candidatus Woesearchaeota archaeon]